MLGDEYLRFDLASDQVDCPNLPMPSFPPLALPSLFTYDKIHYRK